MLIFGSKLNTDRIKAAKGLVLIFFIIIFVGCNNQSKVSKNEIEQTKDDKAIISEIIKETVMAEEIELEQTESTIMNVMLHSKFLDKDMRVSIYVPKGYSKKTKYPVLYFSHGFNGNEQEVMDLLAPQADFLIEEDKINPLIIVAPEMDNSFGLNSSEKYWQDTVIDSLLGEMRRDHGMYEDYLCKEVIPYVDTNYCTMNTKDGRYIGGISMGGFIALHTAFYHQDIFSKAGGHSPGLFIDPLLSPVKGWIYSNEKLRAERDPIYFAKEKEIKGLDIYLDCGSEDEYELYKGCAVLYGILMQKGIKVQYHTSQGRHDSTYITKNIPDYLLFYSGKN